jgi:hypothetical protein
MEAALKAFFTQNPRGALAVYLFGRVARGEAHADSHVDFGVLFASDPPATLTAASTPSKRRWSGSDFPALLANHSAGASYSDEGTES